MQVPKSPATRPGLPSPCREPPPRRPGAPRASRAPARPLPRSPTPRDGRLSCACLPVGGSLLGPGKWVQTFGLAAPEHTTSLSHKRKPRTNGCCMEGSWSPPVSGGSPAEREHPPPGASAQRLPHCSQDPFTRRKIIEDPLEFFLYLLIFTV